MKMERPKSRSRRELPLVQLLPNFLTLAALCSGLTAMRFAILERYELAVALIVLAALLDGLDGRVARLLSSESAIGAELDSLADFLSFGVAPGFILYFWSLKTFPGFGWIAVLILAICCALRLARFNIASSAPAAEGKVWFQGVPSPAGALLTMMPMYAAFFSDGTLILPAPAVALWAVGMAALMISQLPTWSFKSSTVYADHARYILVAFVALAALLLNYPWLTLFLLGTAYLATLPFAYRQHRRLRQDTETTETGD
jgi:CDP-diacylglycerol---serine O-phosphatidyltransferase